MDALIIENRRVFVNENALAAGIRYGSAFAIVHDELGYHKICTKWTCKPLYNMRSKGVIIARNVTFCISQWLLCTKLLINSLHIFILSRKMLPETMK